MDNGVRIGADCFWLVMLDKYHWMLYFLTPAMYPLFLITLDKELNSVPITVWVGQVGIFIPIKNPFTDPILIGCQQCWTTRQTMHYTNTSTSVWLSATEQAELAIEEFILFAYVLVLKRIMRMPTHILPELQHEIPSLFHQ